MGMTQQEKAAFNQQFIYNPEVGWRERYVHEGGKIYNLESEEGIESFNQNFIYNPEVGWRKRTLSQRIQKETGNVLDPVVGEKILRPVGEGTASVFQYIVAATPTALKFIAIGVGAGAAATVVLNSMQVVKKVAQS